ncbi:MAG: hypothetical protein Q9180_004706 [Flavoplaca navasiana]
MHSSISLFLAASSLFVARGIAAPAGLSPNARDAPTQTISNPPTSTTSDIDLATMTPAPAQKRQAGGATGDINILEDFVLPQSKSSSSSSTSSSSSFVFIITRPTPPAGIPAPVQKRQALGNINMLEDFVLPQSISSSSSTTTSSTFAFVVRPTAPAAAPVNLAERNVPRALKNEDPSFGALAALVFPQKISSSSAVPTPTPTPTPTPAAELSPSRHPLARPVA